MNQSTPLQLPFPSARRLGDAEETVRNAIRLYRLFLESALSFGLNQFTTRDREFHNEYTDLADTFGIDGIIDPNQLYTRWNFNLASLGLASAGIISSDIRSLLFKIENGDTGSLIDELAISPVWRMQPEILEGLVTAAAENTLRHFFWLLSDSTKPGTPPLTVHTRFTNAHKYGLTAASVIHTLAERYPLQLGDDDLNEFAWTYNIYKLVLNQLGWNPN